MTAWPTFSPRYASAVSFIFWRIIAEISGGDSRLPSTSTWTSPLAPATTL